ncbi:MAG: hypothetical protein ACLTZY_01200 [Alistipes indistinctus]
MPWRNCVAVGKGHHLLLRADPLEQSLAAAQKSWSYRYCRFHALSRQPRHPMDVVERAKDGSLTFSGTRS